MDGLRVRTFRDRDFLPAPNVVRPEPLDGGQNALHMGISSAAFWNNR